MSAELNCLKLTPCI